MAKFDDLRKFMDDSISRLGLSGIDCIVHQDYKEIFRHTSGYGNMEEKTPIPPKSIHNIYSATKVITCVAALQLLERGQFLLTDPLYSYMPEYKDMLVKTGTFHIFPAKNHIRIFDLFAMTSGISYDRDTPAFEKLNKETNGDFSSRDFMRIYAETPLLHEPGEGWNYGYSHDVLSVLIEVVSGMTFDEYLKKNIFGPLGMNDAYFYLPEEKRSRRIPQYAYNPVDGSVTRGTDECLGQAGKRHDSGGGGLIMTGEDYMLFADALSCGGVGANGERIISKRSIDLMSQNHLVGPQLEGFKKVAMPPGNGYGLGVTVCVDPTTNKSLTPKGQFGWGGIGGVQCSFNTELRLSYYVVQHLFASPKHLIQPHMMNILFANL